jgi:hypothetical protein
MFYILTTMITSLAAYFGLLWAIEAMDLTWVQTVLPWAIYCFGTAFAFMSSVAYAGKVYDK